MSTLSNPLQGLVLSLIHFYIYTQPLRRVFYVSLGINPNACKHSPTCSQYALTAIKQYGTIQGGYLSFKRLWSCR